jgi:hypothetical protein
VRYQRLILEAGPNNVTVRFHPRLTVIAGVGRLERDSLVGEMLGALAGGRAGAHLEILDDSGRKLAVIRPDGPERDRVIDTGTGEDVSEEFAPPGTRIDLLHHFGLTVESARRRSRMMANDVQAASKSDTLVAELANMDQTELWAAAERLRASDQRLKGEAEAMGATPEDAPMIEEIERRHEQFEAAQRRHEQIRHHGVFIGGACAVAAMPAYALNRFAALPFAAVATLALIVGVVFRRRMEKAREAEQSALAAAGARSYIGFHLQRVHGIMEGQHDRRRLSDAAEEHRHASEAWKALAGDVAVDWAIGIRDRVLAAARRRADDQAAGEAVAAGGPGKVEPTDLAHALVTRLADLRHAGPSGESLPLILDEPLEGVEPSVKQWMLELIGRSAGSPQVVYLTEDEDVAAWARMEALSGQLSVLEPNPEHEDTLDHQTA